LALWQRYINDYEYVRTPEWQNKIINYTMRPSAHRCLVVFCAIVCGTIHVHKIFSNAHTSLDCIMHILWMFSCFSPQLVDPKPIPTIPCICIFNEVRGRWPPCRLFTPPQFPRSLCLFGHFVVCTPLAVSPTLICLTN